MQQSHPTVHHAERSQITRVVIIVFALLAFADTLLLAILIEILISAATISLLLERLKR